MTRLKKVIIPTLAIIIIAVITAFALANKKMPKGDVASSGFAVVELFTSEGCSSCPPADSLISRIQKENADKPVYILAYHVDYWNRLGWRDPYSNAEYSKRQSKYSAWMHSSSVYTPQIIVNGRKEFIGSEEGTLRNAIRLAEQVPAVVKLNIMEAIARGNYVNYWYRAEGAPKNIVLTVALIQKQARINVLAGENSGRMLSHVQIVRELQTVPLNSKAEGNGTLNIPKDVGRDIELIAFLQNQTTGQILAATSYEPTTGG